MAFTNIWDQTFPQDSAKANQLGVFLRQFKLDMQQRMAAISGVDTARPAFARDLQPASWNGLLFFALDSGRVYRFQNPAFIDLTLLFGPQNNFFKDQRVTLFGGDTNLHSVSTITLPVGTLQSTSRIRVSYFAQANFPIQNPGEATVVFNGNNISQFTIPGAGGPYGVWVWVIGGNMDGQSGTQDWMSAGIIDSAPAISFTIPGPIQTTVDTTQPVTFGLQYQGATTVGVIAFYGMLIEVL
jgi:hypothetical protein